MNSEPIVYFNGSLVPESAASVSPFSPAFTVGPLPYDTLRGYFCSDREEVLLFRPDAHLRRLRASLKILRFRDLLDGHDLGKAFHDLLRANELKENVYFRFIAWPEQAPTKRFAATHTGIAIRAVRPPERSRSPAACMIAAARRGSDDAQSSRVKAMGQRTQVRAAMDFARGLGIDQLILLNDHGKVAESVSANLFLVRNGRLITPPITAGILEGVTRDTIIALARSVGIETWERNVDPSELMDCDEAFLTSTLLEVLPVASVDGLEPEAGSPGPITARLSALYARATSGQLDGFRHWCDPVCF